MIIYDFSKGMSSLQDNLLILFVCYPIINSCDRVFNVLLA